MAPAFADIDPNVLLGAVSTLVVAVTGLIGAVAVVLKLLIDLKGRVVLQNTENKKRDDQTDAAVSTLAGFNLRRGEMEAKRRGLLSDSQSDDARKQYEINDDVRGKFVPVAPWLRRQWRDAQRRGLSEDQFSLEILSKPLARGLKFDEWLIRAICVPFAVGDGACLKMAVVIAQELRGDDDPESSDKDSDDKKARPDPKVAP